jgi:uncharacterized membrane protein YcgQ (UPF0703/DUF1980 family)
MKVLLLAMLLALMFALVGCSGNDGEVIYDSVVEPEYDYSISDLDETNQDNEEAGLDTDLAADIIEADVGTDDTLESPESSETAAPVINLNAEGILEISAFDLPAQVQEIQMYRSAFLGLTIRYVGQFFAADLGDEEIFFVAFIDDGCFCFYGFEVYLNDIPRFDDETWVEVTGVLEEFFLEDEERYILRLDVSSLIEV